MSKQATDCDDLLKLKWQKCSSSERLSLLRNEINKFYI